MGSTPSLPLSQAIRASLSPARLATYEHAADRASRPLEHALLLYSWNARVSEALLTPLHIFEVVVRNAVADALQAVYGPDWPWSATFEKSLPDTRGTAYKPRGDLSSARSKAASTGAVIADMTFVVWEKMLTRRFDERIWNLHLRRVFPNFSAKLPVSAVRQEIYEAMNRVRLLRNRIAHHEPIFTRDLKQDFKIIQSIIEARCTASAGWMYSEQQAVAIIDSRPFK